MKGEGRSPVHLDGGPGSLMRASERLARVSERAKQAEGYRGGGRYRRYSARICVFPPRGCVCTVVTDLTAPWTDSDHSSVNNLRETNTYAGATVEDGSAVPVSGSK
jgi:hypothetical protein